MSNQEKQPHEPAKKAPQVARKPAREQKPRKRRGFFSQLFSHLMVALIAVIGVATYMHWNDILNYTGSRVCSYDMLGKYASQPVKVPPAGMSKPADEKTQSKAPPKPQDPPQDPPKAKDSEQTDVTAKTVPAPQETSFNDSLEAARKLFWAEDPSTPQAYEKLIAKNPENADLQAELGNVYFKFGKTDQAAKQYSSAGVIFSKLKNTEKVSEMVKILEKIAPEEAEKLRSSSQ